MLNALRMIVLPLMLVWLGISAAFADGIEIRKAEAHFADDSYQLTLILTSA
ncbi:MAG: hypothetical protein WDM70_09455 [Nitrosomonadales bacterium]